MSDWCLKKLEECTDILDHLRIPVNEEERSETPGNTPYYGANGLQGFIDGWLFNEPLILLAEDGGYFDEFETRPVAYKISGKSWVNNHAHVLRPKEEFDFDFVFYSLEHKNVLPYIKGGTRAKLNQRELRGIEINVPSDKRNQAAISNILITIDQTIEKTEALIHKYQQIKAGLMHDLFTRGLTADGKLRPPREEAPELYQETPIGWIPKEWQLIKASDICYPVTKGTTPAYFVSASDKASVPYLRVENLRFNGSLQFDNSSLFVSKITHNFELTRSKVYVDDILMNIVGPPLGKVSLIPNDYEEWNTNQAVAIFRVLNKKHKKYILYFLLSSFAQRWFYVRARQTSGQVNLTLQMCSDLEIPFPKKETEIRNISNSLDQIFEIIKLEYDLIKKLKNQKSGLMNDLLTGKVSVKIDKEETAHAH